MTLEASLEHLKSGKVPGISEGETDFGAPSDLGEAWLYTLHKDICESNNATLTELFEAIRLADCQRLEELIELYENERHEYNRDLMQPILVDPESLCHPLCQCDKCSSLCQGKRNQSPLPAAVDLLTDEGLTMLHAACIYGRPKVVDFLIGAGSNLNAKDSQVRFVLAFWGILMWSCYLIISLICRE